MLHLNVNRVDAKQCKQLFMLIVVGFSGFLNVAASSSSMQGGDTLPEVVDGSNYITTSRPIEDCIFMTLEEGQYVLRSQGLSETCGVYVSTDPDKQVLISFDYVDVSCEDNGLVSVVDGWELGGDFFPGHYDHPKLLERRYHEFCGSRKPLKHYLASQNVAMIQYRVPTRAEGFQITVQFVKNLSPCNVLLQGYQGVYTLRNYGQRINCSVSAIFPSHIDIISMSIGIQGKRSFVELETGIQNQCPQRGMHDFVEIIGSNSWDTSLAIPAMTMCGLESNPQNLFVNIMCGTSTIRLVSSGQFDDTISVSFRPIEVEEMLSAQVTCDEK